VNRCHECESWNNGVGTRQCKQCAKYRQFQLNNTKRNDVPINIVPQAILESIAQETDDQVTKVIKAVRQLPPQLAAIISMLYFANLTQEQVASLLKISRISVTRKNFLSLEIIKKSIFG
jgi:DNA-directed RNA polymerase specialized sigma subunit